MLVDSGTSAWLSSAQFPTIAGIGGDSSIVISDARISFVDQGSGKSRAGSPGVRRLPQAARSNERLDSLPKAIIDNWNALALSGISAQKYAAIYKLAQLKDGWRGPNSAGLQSESLRHFLDFWLKISAAATAPHLSLSPRGHLIGQWYKNSKRNLMLEFLAKGKIYVGLQEGDREYDAVDDLDGAIEFLTGRGSRPLRWR